MDHYDAKLCICCFCCCRRAIEIDEEEDDKNVLSVPSQELNAAITDLTSRLENLRTCNDLINKHGRALQGALIEVESGEDLPNRTKTVTERATIFRISSNAMINVSVSEQRQRPSRACFLFYITI